MFVCFDNTVEVALPKTGEICNLFLLAHNDHLTQEDPLHAGAQESLMRMLDVSKKCGLPLDELSDACLKAVARWQVR